MADKENQNTGGIRGKRKVLREYKEKFQQMCQENKMIKGSTSTELYKN